MKKKLTYLIVAGLIAFLIGFGVAFFVSPNEEKEKLEEPKSESVESTEIPAASSDINEENLEIEGFEDEPSELISGTIKDSEDEFVLGARQDSPIYYSQLDSRWRYHSYTITGNTSQNIGSSGCGPTSAAMLVSTLKGTILPPEMGDLYLSHGFRTANNGTYTSAFKWTANYFGLEFKQVNSTFAMADSIRDEGFMYVVSCSEGLFTTGGHYIVVYGREGDTLKIYDPYMYSGKFESYGRSGKVTVSGNTVYCTITNFKAYANAKGFYGMRGDNKTPVTPTPEPSTPVQPKTMYINTSSLPLNVRNTAGGSVIGSLPKGTEVTVYEESNGWSRVSQGWVSSSYLSSTKPQSDSQSNTSTINYSTKVGNIYTMSSTTTLYSKSNLTGTVYNYLKGTRYKVISHSSSNVDYIYIIQTGRYAYMKVSNSSTQTNTQPSRNTVGTYKYLKACTLYSNSNLSGTKYTYLNNTKVKINKNVSSSVDYIYVVKTGRYAYVNINSYK